MPKAKLAAAVANPKPAPTTEQLVSAAVLLKREIAQREADLKKLEEALIAKGPGKHSGLDGESITVVAGSLPAAGKITYELAEKDLEQGRALAGAAFGKLFERQVIHIPCEGFEHVVPKLLTPATGRDLLQLCQRESKGFAGKRPYVKYA